MKTATRFIYLSLTLVFFSFLSGCKNSDNDSAEQQALNDALNKWTAADTGNYTFEYRRLCFCPQEFNDPMMVNIVNDSVLSAISLATNLPVIDDVRDTINSVEGMFDLLQEAIDTRANTITVNYNDELGYPESIYIDYDEAVADEELSFTADNLVLLTDISGIVGVTWKMVSFNTIAGPQPLNEGSEITLFFSLDSFNPNFGGNAGCNDYGGIFEFDQADTSISIGSINQTLRLCDQPEGLMDQEQLFLSALGNVQSYNQNGTNLQLVIGTDSALEFEAVD